MAEWQCLELLCEDGRVARKPGPLNKSVVQSYLLTEDAYLGLLYEKERNFYFVRAIAFGTYSFQPVTSTNVVTYVT